MKWTGLNELRTMFLEFFEAKKHLRLSSFPLVPQNDDSLLLINSGMAPMKTWFLGTEPAPSPRVTTCQKCIRTPDIDNVGITDRHGTFFEMLGNFSFQDYFKKEAIRWSWEFFTSPKFLDIPKERIHITVYTQDDDAYHIWNKDIGVSPEHIVRLGKEHNFWEHGSGPCGPCSEIYYDRGDEHGCCLPDCKPGCDCDRFIEVWNLVFAEFDSDGKGNYTKLEKPNIDTGMGLERLACIMQGADNLFETDTIRKILEHVEKASGKTYGKNKKDDISIRIITDHIRSTVFMVSDGILPSNEARGYVLRRLLRRAARHGHKLGIEKAFLADIAQTVMTQNESAYPELREKESFITKTITAEEERFSRTIDAGLTLLNNLLDKVIKDDEIKTFSGIEAFKLHDTFGFPLDLTMEIAAEVGIKVDERAFNKELEKQRKAAREDRASRDIGGWDADVFSGLNLPATNFVGQTEMKAKGKVLALSDGKGILQTACSGDIAGEVLVVLDKTPFYAEGGGQVADTGHIKTDHLSLSVLDVQKMGIGYYVHVCRFEAGQINNGDKVSAEINIPRRQGIMRNHTSAHLLQQALREVLGDHVHQAGSHVDNRRMRFDFTHFSALRKDELQKVEDKVNNAIFAAMPISTKEMSIDEARKTGALALFGEHYGDTVRVLNMGNWSIELCGGTHVSNTAQLGSFKILSESSVAAGVRRIEATTGYGVLNLLKEHEIFLQEIATQLKVNIVNDVPKRIFALLESQQSLEAKLESLMVKKASSQIADVFETPTEIDGIKLYRAMLTNTDTGALRNMCDMIRDNDPMSVGALIGKSDGKMTLAVCCGQDSVKRGLKAGSLAKEIATVAGGSGGGRADFAMAGIKDQSKASQALEAAFDIVKNQL